MPRYRFIMLRYQCLAQPPQANTIISPAMLPNQISSERRPSPTSVDAELNHNVDKVRTRLLDAMHRVTAAAIHASDEYFGASLLHIVLNHRPPLKVVELLLEMIPGVCFIRDTCNRCPLHVACGQPVVDEDVVACLVRHSPESCALLDLDGRSPLMHACDIGCKLYDDSPERVKLNSCAIVYLLVGCPAAVNLHDEEDSNAIELAIIGNADLKTIDLLQQVSVYDHHRRQGGDRKKEDERLMQNVLKLLAKFDVQMDAATKMLLDSPFLTNFHT